jgi:Tfp pilus assembly protein PilX
VAISSCSPKPTLRTKPNSEKGFILPVVLGVGVITMLLGVMMIERSSQNRVAAIAQKANARSTAAAEQGVTQLQALLNRYRPLATACSDGTLSATCSSSPWQNISNAVLDPCSTDSTQPITQIQSYAHRDWKDSTTDPADGQFRLVSYEYQPTPTNPEVIGTGTLVVEGRINPDDAIRTATTQLKVNFNITRTASLGTPGLWIQDNSTAGASASVQLLTQVRDSTCSQASATSNAVQQLQRQIQAPYVYQATPGIVFPDLPSEGLSFTPPTSASISAPSPPFIAAIEHPVVALPNLAQSPSGSTTVATSNSVVTYHIQAKGSQSINLTDASDVLEIGTGADTVVLNLEGGMTLKEGAKIRLAPNAKLIVYAHGPVYLAGKESMPAIEQQGTPSATRVQLYVYSPQLPSDPPYAVNLSGDSAPLYFSLLAPASTVTSSANVQGNIWAKSWVGNDSAVITQDSSNLSDLKLLWPPHISPITAWQENP